MTTPPELETPPIPEHIAEDTRILYERFISRRTLDAMPEATGIYRTNGLLITANKAFEAFWRLPPGHPLFGNVNVLEASSVPPRHADAFREASAGVTTVCPPIEIDLSADKSFDPIVRKQLWMKMTIAPLRDADDQVRFVMLIFQNCTEDVGARERITEAEETLESQRQTIEALRAAQVHIKEQQALIRELSIPILEIWPGVLTLPVVGHVDAKRAAEMTERLLASVTSMRARYVILDLTGLEQINADTADRLLGILRAVPLLGSKTMVAGINPRVADALVKIGSDLSGVETVRNVRDALAQIIPLLHER